MELDRHEGIDQCLHESYQLRKQIHEQSAQEYPGEIFPNILRGIILLLEIDHTALQQHEEPRKTTYFRRDLNLHVG